LAKNTDKYEGKATTIIAYAKNENEIEFFEGTVEGKIIEPIHT
jgi:inosine/xanthosine triphosphate pyrophosphatase family protein